MTIPQSRKVSIVIMKDKMMTDKVAGSVLCRAVDAVEVEAKIKAVAERPVDPAVGLTVGARGV